MEPKSTSKPTWNVTFKSHTDFLPIAKQIAIQGFRDSGTQGFKDSGIQGFRDSGIQ
jgi:hypothetical protein